MALCDSHFRLFNNSDKKQCTFWLDFEIFLSNFVNIGNYLLNRVDLRKKWEPNSKIATTREFYFSHILNLKVMIFYCGSLWFGYWLFWIQYRTFCEFNHFFLKGGAFLYQLFYMICSIENNVWKKTRVNMILFSYLVIYLHILTLLVLFYTGIMLLHCH